jgi:ribosomal protein S4
VKVINRLNNTDFHVDPDEIIYKKKVYIPSMEVSESDSSGIDEANESSLSDKDKEDLQNYVKNGNKFKDDEEETGTQLSY